MHVLKPYFFLRENEKAMYDQYIVFKLSNVFCEAIIKNCVIRFILRYVLKKKKGDCFLTKFKNAPPFLSSFIEIDYHLCFIRIGYFAKMNKTSVKHGMHQNN